LYHGEINVINRTFGAARQTRVVDRSNRLPPFFNRQPMTSDASIDADRRKAGQKSAKPRQLVRLSCAGCAFAGRVARIHRLTEPGRRRRCQIPFSGGDEPM
jgi:hypothetical protein